MAPRRGGGGSSSGVSISTCPGAFADTYSQVNFANIVLFFVVFFGISIALCSVRKRSGAGKKLIGYPYIAALFYFILSFALELIAAVLYECGSLNSDRYLALLIADNVFWYIAVWTLLFVVVYTLNTMLRERLGGVTVVFKAIYLAIVGLMFALSCGQMGVQCYNIWTQMEAGMYAFPIVHPAEQLRIAYNVMFFLSVLASGALSLMTIFALRSRQHPLGDLIGWVSALLFAMVFWTLINIVFAASYLNNNILSFATTAALSYIGNFFQALSFIFLLCIAKHAAWTKSADSSAAHVYSSAVQQQQPTAVPQQQQYAYNGNNANGQQYHY